MGLKVRVQIVSADPDSRRIEMALVEEDSNASLAKRQDTRTKKENKTPRRAKKKASNAAPKASANGRMKPSKRSGGKSKS